jgi:D-glycero-D-manno-heptose 1,7-bisphosphate phosphatase
VGKREVKGLVILDRDGTLIDIVRDEDTGFIGVAFHPSQVRLLNGVVEGLTLLRDAGFAFAIATNQPAPAKGQFSEHSVVRTNAALVSALAEHGIVVAHVAVCMHHPVGGAGGRADLVRACECRKPGTGLLRECLHAVGAAVDNSWMIGDSPGDIEAGRSLGLKTALVFEPKRCELCPLRSGATSSPSVSAPNLKAIAEAILRGAC